ncbi:MAG: polysaccharide biosynthesis tyrosine autokinase [Alphaproteobacteria bacterium]|nr:polysaccharide biosynthesis tyrosine autokinase [Alphaproteobacteria bacterium]
MSIVEREDDGGEPGFNPERIISAVRRRWRIAAGITVAVTLIAAGVAYLLPDRYEASATLQLDPRKKNVANIEGVVSDLYVDTAAIESEAEVIASRNVLLKVIERLNLRNDPEFSTSGLFSPPTEADAQSLEPANGISEPAKETAIPRRDQFATAFARNLEVSRVRNTLLLEVTFTSSDPDKAALIANTIAEVYIAEQLAAKSDLSQTATNLLDGHLESLRKRVRDAEARVEAYKAEKNIFASEGQILSEKELTRWMERTVEARNRTVEMRAQFEQAKKLGDSGHSMDAIQQVVSSLTVRGLKEKYAEVSRRKAELSTRYGERHPEMLKVRAELDDAQRQLDTEISSLIANLENEYVEAVARERELLAGLEQKKREEAERRAANVQLNELEREADTSRQIYQVLLSRYKQNAASQTLQLPDARIVEFADTPSQPAAPKRKQIVALAAAAGLTLGLALILALEFATPGIGRPEEAEELLALEHISSLPQLDSASDDAGDPLRATRLMIAAPTSGFAEAIRSLRREIDVRHIERGSRIILIAASLPGEGASIVASNLAHYYAQTGDRVVLVDADLRRSNLTRQLAPQRRAGLAEVLNGAIAPEQAILRDQLTNLHFLPATGGILVPSGQAELLASAAMPRVLGRLKSQFDTIIIDAPPLLPVIDTRIIADYADQIVFVMAWRRTPKQLARKAMKLLSVNADRLAGVVVNQVATDILADASGIELVSQSHQPESVLAA